ncbi:ommatidial rotation [Mactra antiquata]
MEFCVKIVLFLSAIVFCVPTDTEAKRVYKILEGDNLLVICKVPDDVNNLHLFWTKNDTKSSYHQDGDRLEILNIGSKAHGDYICYGSNTSLPEPDTNGSCVIDVITVDVQYAARIESFNVSPYVLMENQTFSVSCDMEGNPPPNWTIRNRDTGLAWMNALHAGADTTLTSPPALCEYTGYWECTGYNALSDGVNVTRGHQVTINCSPRPVYQRNKYTVTSFTDRVAFLVMDLLGHPAPNFTWSRDDGLNFTSSVEQHDFENTTILEIKSVSIPDFGNYTLKMENVYGTYIAHYQLKANGKPEAPTNIQFSHVTDTSVTIRWTPGYDMGSKQHFIIMKLYEGTNRSGMLSSYIYCPYVNLRRNQTCTYTVDYLYSDTQYNLTVAAENEKGFLTLSKESIRFKTNEAQPEAEEDSSTMTSLVFGLALGILGSLVFLAFIVYLVKYRHYKTSYEVEKTHKIYDDKVEKLNVSNT